MEFIFILFQKIVFNIFHVSHFFYILGGRLSGSGSGGIVYDGYFLSTSFFLDNVVQKTNYKYFVSTFAVSAGNVVNLYCL